MTKITLDWDAVAIQKLADDVELQILGCCCFLDRSVSRVARKS
jgi:hypothetical protein